MGSCWSIYFLWDHFYFYPRETARDIARDEARVHRLRFAGWQLNGLLLIGVIFAIAFLDPSKAFPERIGIRGCICAKSCNWACWRYRSCWVRTTHAR